MTETMTITVNSTVDNIPAAALMGLAALMLCIGALATAASISWGGPAVAGGLTLAMGSTTFE